MSTRQSNIVILIICFFFLLFRTLYPLNSNDSIGNMLLSIILNIFSSITLYIILHALMNIRQLWFYFQTQIFFMNKDIRLSISYQFRIQVENKYLLIKSSKRPYFQPVGGVYKTLNGSERIFEKLGVRCDDIIDTKTGIAKNDLRVYVKGANIISFINWFNSREDRELSPWREFYEELIESNFLPKKEFPYINYRFKKNIQTPIINLDNGKKGIFIYEVYDLVPDESQIKILKDLLQSGNTENFIWVTEDIINNLGHSKESHKYIYELSQHTKWVLNLKWSK